MTTPRTTRRPWRPLLILAVIVVAGFLGLALFVAWLDLPEEPRIITDDRLMELTDARLDELDAHLTEFGPILATEPPTVSRSGCGSDSGDVFQPATTRTWTTRANENWIAAAALADALKGRGWSAPGGRDAFGNYELTLDRGDWSARAVVSPLGYDELYLRAQVVGTNPCRGVAR